jgi:hypothetical protein
MPGKLRLSHDNYLAAQTIYFPGFTIGGACEPIAILVTLALLVLTPAGSTAFWLILAALLCLLAMHGVYWTRTHETNRYWLKEQQLGKAGKAFFSAGGERSGSPAEQDWTVLRDRWEYSHVVRAALAMLGLIALVIAVTGGS